MSVGTIILQFIGFLIQVLPIAILCVVPFSDDNLRMRRKNILFLFSGSMFVFSVGFTIMSFAMYKPDGSHNAVLQPVSNIYMLACVILWAAAFCILIRFPAVGKIIVLILMVYYAAVMFILNNYMVAQYCNWRGIVETGDTFIIYGIETVIGSAILLVVTLPFIYMFLRREVRFSLTYMENKVLTRSCICISTSCLLFFLCVFSLSTFTDNFYYVFTDAFVLFILLSFVFTDGIMFYMLFSEVRLNAEKDQIEEQLRNFNNQYHQISENIERARRDRHDIRHHLNIISTLNHKDAKEELDEYLKSYEASFMELEQMPLCGYPAFDNIIRYYIEYAGNLDIKVETEMYALKEGLVFDVVDLTVLLGNLIENAIEACLNLPADTMRIIRISAKQTDVSFLLKIENSCAKSHDDQPVFTDGRRFISTKHSIGHGQGLKSIQYVAEKYGGSAEFKKADGTFTARIVMNIP